MSKKIRLVCPGINHKEAAGEFIAEFAAHNSTMNGSSGLERYSGDYEAWLQKLELEGSEKTVEAGKVPATTFFAVIKDSGVIAGMINIRHRLNEYLETWGGHIGYSVRPTERGKGFAVEMLRLALDFCRERGLQKVLVTCDRDNIPSAKTIQRNGGVLENEVYNEETASFFQRYWITLDGAGKTPPPGESENTIVSKILTRAGMPGLLSELDSNLTLSELNTLLLELFRMKTGEMKPADLLRQYAQNRFAKPAELDPAVYHRVSAGLLEYAKKSGYTALELSPVSVLGTCSVSATVDQNKVLSALRGTEVLSDATNALTLHAAFLKSRGGFGKGERLRYCAVHRHLRTQKFQGANQLPHFVLYSMVISGVDEGNFKFEKEALRETFIFYHEYLSREWGLKNLNFVILPRAGEAAAFTEELLEFLSEENSRQINVEVRQEPATAEPNKANYYRGLQFKIKADYEEKEIEIGDGGFVDWSAKLLQNKKERLLVSGIGLERLLKIQSAETRM